MSFWENQGRMGKHQTGITPAASDAASDDSYLTKLLVMYSQNLNREHMSLMLSYLRTCSVWVPLRVRTAETTLSRGTLENVSRADYGNMQGMQPADGSLYRALGMQADILKKEDGSLCYLVFSEKEQAPESYRRQFSWIRMPFQECAGAAMACPGVHAMAINVFSQNILISEQMLREMELTAEDPKPSAGGFIPKLAPVRSGAETKLLQTEILECLKWVNQVQQIYLAGTAGGEESYVIVIDDQDHNMQELHAFLKRRLEGLSLSRPICCLEYPKAKPMLDSIGCRPFYVKSGAMRNRKQALTTDSKVILRVLYNENGESEEYRVEIRKAMESHYAFRQDAMDRLKEYFHDDWKEGFVEGLHEYLEPYSASLEEAEGAVVNLLAVMGIEYRYSRVSHDDMNRLKSFVK